MPQLDYKDWIQQRAEEIATEEHSQDFYDLPEETRDQVYNQATEDYTDMVSAKADRLREKRSEEGL